MTNILSNNRATCSLAASILPRTEYSPELLAELRRRVAVSVARESDTCAVSLPDPSLRLDVVA